jgi:hypothetical protein
MIWIPLASAVYALYAWLILQNKIHGGHWFWVAWIVGALPLWLVTSRWSKDLMFDGMLYDVVMFTAYGLATAYFTQRMATMGLVQWLGFMMIVAGFFLVKYK